MQNTNFCSPLSLPSLSLTSIGGAKKWTEILETRKVWVLLAWLSLHVFLKLSDILVDVLQSRDMSRCCVTSPVNLGQNSRASTLVPMTIFHRNLGQPVWFYSIPPLVPKLSILSEETKTSHILNIIPPCLPCMSHLTPSTTIVVNDWSNQ